MSRGVDLLCCAQYRPVARAGSGCALLGSGCDGSLAPASPAEPRVSCSSHTRSHDNLIACRGETRRAVANLVVEYLRVEPRDRLRRYVVETLAHGRKPTVNTRKVPWSVLTMPDKHVPGIRGNFKFKKRSVNDVDRAAATLARLFRPSISLTVEQLHAAVCLCRTLIECDTKHLLGPALLRAAIDYEARDGISPLVDACAAPMYVGATCTASRAPQGVGVLPTPTTHTHPHTCTHAHTHTPWGQACGRSGSYR